MLGFTEEELMELSFRDVTYPDDRNNDVEAVRKLREDQIQKHTTEKRIPDKEWGSDLGLPIADENL